jgi:hypothetical protein
MEAKSLQTVSSTMTVVRDSTEIRAALTNELEISGKRVLVCKGHDNIAKTVEFVYRAFADHTDLSGEPFLLSRTTHKGLCHRDSWGSYCQGVGIRLRTISKSLAGLCDLFNQQRRYASALNQGESRFSYIDQASTILCPAMVAVTVADTGNSRVV